MWTFGLQITGVMHGYREDVLDLNKLLLRMSQEVCLSTPGSGSTRDPEMNRDGRLRYGGNVPIIHYKMTFCRERLWEEIV